MLRDALGKDLVLELPEGEALEMKADLGLSWFHLDKLRRLVINYCNQSHNISSSKIPPRLSLNELNLFLIFRWFKQ